MANPLKAISRYRTGKGFGVHSPFAFNFILKVLREKWEYYKYPIIANECRKHKGEIKEKYGKLIFRIINHFNPESVALIGSDCEVAEICAKCVAKKTDIIKNRYSDGTKFLIVGKVDDSSRQMCMDILSRAFENNSVIVFQDIHHSNGLWLSVTQSMRQGMSFSNGHFGVAVCKKELPLKHYRVWL